MAIACLKVDLTPSKIYGNFHVRNLRDFKDLCQRYGIKFDCNEIYSAKAKGYKGRFDSRHTEIVFLNMLAARRFERALCYLQNNENAFKKTKYVTFLKSVEQSSYFSLLDSPEILHTFTKNDPKDSWKAAKPLSKRSNGNKCSGQSYRYWKIGTYNIQSVRNELRLKRLNAFLEEENIDCLALNETNWTGNDFSHHFKDYS